MKYYILGIPPYQTLPQYGIFTDRKEASTRAKLENKSGPNRGRGVKVYACDIMGNLKTK